MQATKLLVPVHCQLKVKHPKVSIDHNSHQHFTIGSQNSTQQQQKQVQILFSILVDPCLNAPVRPHDIFCPLCT